jgi:hypothetical protein
MWKTARFAVIRSKCATPFRMMRCATLKPDQSSNRERRMAAPKIRAHFIEPMLLVRTESLPAGEAWVYELWTASGLRRSKAEDESSSGPATTRTSTPSTRPSFKRSRRTARRVLSLRDQGRDFLAGLYTITAIRICCNDD